MIIFLPTFQMSATTLVSIKNPTNKTDAPNNKNKTKIIIKCSFPSIKVITYCIIIKLAIIKPDELLRARKKKIPICARKEKTPRPDSVSISRLKFFWK